MNWFNLENILQQIDSWINSRMVKSTWIESWTESKMNYQPLRDEKSILNWFMNRFWIPWIKLWIDLSSKSCFSFLKEDFLKVLKNGKSILESIYEAINRLLNWFISLFKTWWNSKSFALISTIQCFLNRFMNWFMES